MSNSFAIDFDWLERSIGDEIDRAFFADIGLVVEENSLTRNYDLMARTVRNRMRGCAYRLASWFAANWWRLRWEPEPLIKDTDWRMAHTIAAAGGGYVWPNASFESDGHFLDITLMPKEKPPPFEPIQYINRIHARIPAEEFECAIDNFMEAVLSRSQALGLKDTTLSDLWTDAQAERNGPSILYRMRKLEAMAGYDPDQAPEDFLKGLLEDADRLGASAVEEIAAAARQTTSETLAPIRELDKSKGKPMEGGYRVSLPEEGDPLAKDLPGFHAWEQSGELARRARRKWGLENAPISDKQLAELIHANPVIFSEKTASKSPLQFALQVGDGRESNLYFNKRNPASRRFAVCRLIGDRLISHDPERLLPATDTKTFRQKFQRAFAQEFLCPFEALIEKMQTQTPNEDDIQEAAEHFHVSPQLVDSTLRNKHIIPREAFFYSE